MARSCREPENWAGLSRPKIGLKVCDIAAAKDGNHHFVGWIPHGETTLTTRIMADTTITPLDKIQRPTP
jgi:hypothetical protein